MRRPAHSTYVLFARSKLGSGLATLVEARMQSREFDRWAKIREQGMLRYVLLKGVVFYGLPMFLLMTFVIPHPRLTVAQSAFLWVALAGAGFGYAMWAVQERRFRKVAARS